EQQLLVVILSLLDIKADAHISSSDVRHKDKLVQKFQRPLSQNLTNDPHSAGVLDEDLEVLVMSYYMNSGLNLHYNCCNMHAFSPAPSSPIWIQACGRIVRFGQTKDCLIIKYYVKNTSNHRQIANATSNALAGISALINGYNKREGEVSVNIKGVKVVGDQISVRRDILNNFVMWNNKLYDLNDKETPKGASTTAALLNDPETLTPARTMAGRMQPVTPKDTRSFSERLGSSGQLARLKEAPIDVNVKMPDNNKRPPATPSKIGRTTKAGEKRANVKKGGDKKPSKKKTSSNKRKQTANNKLSPNTPKPQPQPRSC
ncbi:uncharacterized protein BDR25DRAFT_320692, partial [Lindgomyces ingoldianus]